MSEKYLNRDESSNEMTARQEGPHNGEEAGRKRLHCVNPRGAAIDSLEDLWARYRQNRILLDLVSQDIIYANGQALREDTCEGLAGVVETFKELEPRLEAAIEGVLRGGTPQ